MYTTENYLEKRERKQIHVHLSSLSMEDRQRKRMRVQGCASPSLCSNPLQYLNIGQGLYERTSIICCLGDACKRAAPRLPLGFVKPNGKECPACFVRRPDRCSQRMVDCSGEETKCLDVEYSKREVPSGLVKPNGKECPACFARIPARCSERMVDCSGKENKCIDVEYTKKEGNPLWCTYCSREGTRCNGYKIVCEPSEKSCFVSAIESTIGWTQSSGGPDSLHPTPQETLSIWAPKDAEEERDKVEDKGERGKANSLRCYTCQGLGSLCRGSNQICANGENTCFVSRIETTLDGPRKRMRVEGCASSTVCKKPLQYLNLGHGLHERTSIICCVGFACRNAFPRIPSGLVKPNGKECPACFAKTPATCEHRMVDCSGEETQCIALLLQNNEDPLHPRIYRKGCITEALCPKLGGTYYIPTGFSVRYRKCNAASPIN
ncbi:hypothetical protein JD844_005743 [Phrynosoma platyrhinos]|uniref:UPAR/Ly6 domain-containing protein n=1 Tax=Phrynosoma platyrhinos TaxID=52577 RepID=A0ABQ7TNQ1_PHRPL|nr:hypothetical protein JD844_005743 [Phrynosoma platyrhinos]